MAASDPFRIRRSSSQSQMSPPSPNPNPQTLTLTVDNLREHNRASAYYRSLTNSSALYLRSSNGPGGGSPGRESVITSSTSLPQSNTSASSSVLLTIQEWVPSCFSKTKRAAAVAVPAQFLRKEMWDPGLPETGDGKKPLRESDVAAAPGEVAVAVAPAAQSSALAAVEAAMKVKEKAKEKEKEREREREFIWAYKYRPRFLNEFVCNQDQAKELSQMVSFSIGSFFFMKSGSPLSSAVSCEYANLQSTTRIIYSTSYIAGE